MMGALGNWFILKCCSALTTFVFAFGSRGLGSGTDPAGWTVTL